MSHYYKKKIHKKRIKGDRLAQFGIHKLFPTDFLALFSICKLELMGNIGVCIYICIYIYIYICVYICIYVYVYSLELLLVPSPTSLVHLSGYGINGVVEIGADEMEKLIASSQVCNINVFFSLFPTQ